MTINGRVETRKRLESDVILRCERKRASKDDVGDGMASLQRSTVGPSPFEGRGACHRAGHFGPTRWRPPQGDGQRVQAVPN
jgi:hypothetical protein